MRLSEAELMRRVVKGEFGAQVRWLDVERPIGHAEIGRQVAAALRPDGIDTVLLATHAYPMRRARLVLDLAGLLSYRLPGRALDVPVPR